MDCSSLQPWVDWVLLDTDPVGSLGLVLWLGGIWFQRRLLSGRSASRFTLKTSRFKLKWKRESEYR